MPHQMSTVLAVANFTTKKVQQFQAITSPLNFNVINPSTGSVSVTLYNMVI